MPLPLFTGATNTVQLLADRPNQTDGLTPAQLKLKFDQHAINYETYSNDTLVPAINLELISKTEALTTHKTSTDHDGRYYTELEIDNKVALLATKTELAGVVLGQIPPGSITDEELSNEAGMIKSQLAESLTQLATGTATSITLTIGTLTDLYTKTFIIKASNNGSATTINGKPLYKPNTTVSPTLTSGKAITVWYNLASDCFFIKASATGKVTSDKVLAGETYSTEEDTDLVGTMINRGAVTFTPSTVAQAIPKGYHDGLGKVNGVTNAIASNIKKGVNIAGVVGNLEERLYYVSSIVADSASRCYIPNCPFVPSVISATNSWGINAISLINTGAAFYRDGGSVYIGSANHVQGSECYIRAPREGLVYTVECWK